MRERGKEWKAKNKERTRVTSQMYYQKNKAKIAEKEKARRILKPGDAVCLVDGCGRKVAARGYCMAHYQRLLNAGDTDPAQPISLGRSGLKHAQWNGGVIFTGGRFRVYDPSHPSSKGGYVSRYRKVVEESIGRYLLPSEHVHHINGNPSDDRIENLQIVSASEHMRIHRTITGWSTLHSSCVHCQTVERPHRSWGLCRRCYKHLAKMGKLQPYKTHKCTTTI